MAERQDQQPYQIRSHHLSRLLGASIAFQMKESADQSVDTKTLQEFTRGSVAALMKKREGNDRDHSEYAQDIVGQEVEASPRFIEGLTKFYNQFLNLPDDHPVRIQSNVRDGVCNSCVIGDHCKANIDENNAIEKFMYYAKQAGLTALSPKDIGGKTMSLDTDMGTLRKVICFVRDTKKCKNIDPNDFEDLSIAWNYSK